MIAILRRAQIQIAKASLHLYFRKNSKKALESINETLVRADRTGFFWREALGLKRKLGVGNQLSQTLEEIMSLEMKYGIPDVGGERDFGSGGWPVPS